MGIQRFKLNDLTPPFLVKKKISTRPEQNRGPLYLTMSAGELHPNLLHQILRILVLASDRQGISLTSLDGFHVAELSPSRRLLLGGHRTGFE